MAWDPYCTPRAGARTVGFTRGDGDGGTSATLSTTVTVAAAASMTWTNGGGDGSWNNAANWNPAVVPGEGDDVIIPDGLGAATYDTGTTNLNSLSVDGSLTIAAGTLNVAASSTFGATSSLTLSGGIFGGAGDVTLNGSLTWSPGTLTGAKTITLNGSATVTGCTLDVTHCTISTYAELPPSSAALGARRTPTT